MADEIKSDSSTSESEVSATSSNFDPMKALYSDKTVIPTENAPLYENLHQFESAMKSKEIIPVGHKDLVKKREEEKEKKRLEEERILFEKNQQRYAKFQSTLVPRKEYRVRNVLTRMETMHGPIGVLKTCVDQRLRVKIITRNDRGIRGVLHATVIAFDKQWNLALSDVLEVWKKKRINKRKIPPAMGTPVPKGTAAKLSPVPEVTETPIGNGIVECARHVSQLMVRGEHVVLINVVER